MIDGALSGVAICNLRNVFLSTWNGLSS